MKPARTRALYAGSFDPITRGHLDIIEKALKTFDIVHVAVGANPQKAGLFALPERLQLIGDSAADVGLAGAEVEVGEFAGESVIKYAHRIGATHVVRGLRQSSDFDDEFRYHGVFGRLEPNIPMIHIICRETFLHVSSSTARELASVDEDVSWLVTPSVERALRGKFAG
jgi:pantetheine-phosphate adenylyltransferase